MKQDKLHDAIGKLDDSLIHDADQLRSRRKRTGKWYLLLPFAAAVVCCTVMLHLFMPQVTVTASANAIAEASYPEMAPYPNEADYVDDAGAFDEDGFFKAYDAWAQTRYAQRDQEEGYADGLDHFFAVSARQFLSDAGTENRVYSPLNVYMALSMLAELTDGNSRQQVLDVLGVQDIDTLRAQVTKVWNANYCADGAASSVLANSVWLNQDLSYNQTTMNRLAETYYASSYQGDMGSEAYDKALREWINKQTGNLLQEQAEELSFDSETVLALASTVYFHAKWSDQFNKENTAPDTFHAVTGDQTCDFMHSSNNQEYYWGQNFSAISRDFDDSGSMWLILPDEGTSPDELLAQDDILSMVQSAEGWDNRKDVIVNLSMPKFDVSSDIDLQDGLKSLGVSDVFDADASDFSPMTDMDGIAVSQAEHAVRVTVDEEGCTAAAYTAMMLAKESAPPEDEVDFTLNRPFLFVITGTDNLPLFVGVVNCVG